MPVKPPYSHSPLVPHVALPPWQSGRYYFVPNQSSVQTVSTSGNGTVRAGPVVVPLNVTLVRIGAEVTSAGDAGSLVRLGIWQDDGTGRPGALILDAGTIAGDSATVQEITIAQPLTRGVYWFGLCVQNVTVTQPTLRFNASSGLVPLDAGTSTPAANKASLSVTRSGITGAFPATFGTAGLDPTPVPRIVVKVG